MTGAEHPEKTKLLKKHQVDLGERGVYDKRNPLNDLTGKEWRFSTKSVIPKSYPPSFSLELRNQHGGQKPPELAEELIRTFSKEGELILDPFAGTGSILIGATLARRRAIGIELNPKWKKVYEDVCQYHELPLQELKVGDSREILPKISSESIDFILTDVPFFNMDKLPKTRGKFSRAGEPSRDPLKSSLNKFNDLEPYTKEEWESLLRSVFKECYRVLKTGRYVATFIGNMFRNVVIEKNQKKKKVGRYLMLSAAVASILEDVGFVLKAERIWYDPAKNLGIYGYPFVYIPSIVDQRILVARKEP